MYSQFENAIDLGIINSSGSFTLRGSNPGIGAIPTDSAYKFIIEENCILNITSIGTPNLMFYSSNYDILYSSGTIDVYQYELTPGTYYVIPMTIGTGADVTLNIDYAKSIAGNNSIETAFNWGIVSGERTFESIFIQSNMGMGSGPSSEYYNFTLTEDSLVLISADSKNGMAGMGPNMTVYDEEGKTYYAGGNAAGMMGPSYLELKSGDYTLQISTDMSSFYGNITISQAGNIVGNDSFENAYDWGPVSGENTFENIYIPGSIGMGGDSSPEYYSFSLTENSLISLSTVSDNNSMVMPMPPNMTVYDKEGNIYTAETSPMANKAVLELKAGDYILEVSANMDAFYGDIVISQSASAIGNTSLETAYDWGIVTGTQTFENVYIPLYNSEGMQSTPEYYKFTIRKNSEITINTISQGDTFNFSGNIYKVTSNGSYENMGFDMWQTSFSAGTYILEVDPLSTTLGPIAIEITAEPSNNSAVSPLYISSMYQYPYYCTLDNVTLDENAFVSISDADDADAINNNDIVLNDGYITIDSDDFAILQKAKEVFAVYGEQEHTPSKGYIVFDNIDTEINTAPQFNHFLTVSVNNSEISSSFNKDHTYVEYTIGETTYCYYYGNGSFNATDSRVGAISNYQSVILTNSNAGAVINDSLSSIVSGYNLERNSVASGYLSVSANMLGEEETTEYNIGAISGYATVMLSGYTHWADNYPEKTIVVSGNITGGNSTYKDGVGEQTTSAGYLSLNTNVNVNGNILYYATVNGNGDIRINGNITKGDDSAISYLSGYEYNSSLFYYTPTTTTYQYLNSGMVSLNDATVKDITNYQTVILTDTDAGNIINNTLSQKEVLIEVPSIVKNLVFNSNGTLSVSVTESEAYSIGNTENNEVVNNNPVIDSNGNENTVGSAVYGYAAVTISGYKNWYDNSKNAQVTVNGNIVGGNRSLQSSGYGGNGIVHKTSVGMANLTLANVKGDVTGFSTVMLSDSSVNGEIDNLDNSAYSYSYDRYDYYSMGDYEITKISVTNYTSSGYVNTSNSVVSGDIENYMTVSLTNSSAGNIYRNTLSNITSHSSSYSSTPYLYSFTSASTGSLTVSVNYLADKNQSYSVGNITGYATVTLNGYTDYINSANNIKVSAGVITGGNISGEIYGNFDENNLTGIESSTGYLSLNNADAKSVYGFSSANLTNSAIKGDVIAAYTTTSTYDDKKIYCGSIYNYTWYDSMSNSSSTSLTVSSAANFTLNNSSVTGTIKGYGYVSLTNSVAGSVDMGTAYSASHSYSYNYYADYTFASYTHNASKYASVNISNSEVKNNGVYGTVSNFGYVTVTNSNVGDITMDLLTSINGSCYGSYDSGKITTEYSAQGSATISAAWNADKDYRTGNISGYQNVSISGGNGHKVVVNGNISGGAYSITEKWENYSWYAGIYTPKTQEPTSANSTGSVTLNAGAEVTGNITGYNIVTVNSSTVAGTIESYANTSALMATFTASTIGGVSGYQIVNFNGINNVASINGDSRSNANVTINYGATVTANSVKLDDTDTLNVHGTLVMTGDEFTAKNIAGYGEIVTLQDTYAAIKNNASSNTVKLVNLGQTAENFVSTTSEAADNNSYTAKFWDASQKVSLIQPVSESCFESSTADSEFEYNQTKSVEYNATEGAYYNGYLSGNFDGSCQDLIDYVTFYADKDGILQLSCTTNGVDISNISLVDTQGSMLAANYEIVKGSYYTIGIKLDEKYDNSVSYQLAYLS